MQDATQGSTQQLQPPRTDSVLYFISNVDGDGATSYEVANGSWINYWYGFQFELGGTRYYTGFAWETPERFGAESDDHSPAPGTKVTLAHATFVTSEPGSKTPWKLLGAEPYIGEFGGMEQGNTVDTKRKPETFATDDGRLVLAVPTWSLQSGVRILSYDTLVFNPKDTDNVNDKHWTYIGNVPAGQDNSADCDEDAPGKIACVKNSSKLAFVKQPGLPALRVTVSADPPTSGGDETVEYRYDAARKSYLPTP
ncbi:hypothetical protein [Xanthomonas vasicola]|uniref:hypothetical protein n=1 Tax=Xanthomonas vasicola TaxID=56459 RepID=UPI0001CBF294|nr:hypothetical protein [Xanthomonas vasicola]KFA16353.1 hypothetical protein KWS_0126570 [Xanthomonas vasicola pv. musacearum NCPPB 4384]AZR25542.1 hypothetical protein NX80_002425 [Xanthomonas vasicola pv. arecae]AZR32462.1 hypothetical protein KWO_020190 [Xanthomonas vasicola pv. musacearum NCPPB 4379]AZR36178.1 hypothetical protein NX08_018820 [Xanthomonas vasicola]KEZ95310.1 hypothetical protein A11M_0121880 [Xanthomonas vasicola pv. vasculorum NCPPB 895]